MNLKDTVSAQKMTQFKSFGHQNETANAVRTVRRDYMCSQLELISLNQGNTQFFFHCVSQLIATHASCLLCSSLYSSRAVIYNWMVST